MRSSYSRPRLAALLAAGTLSFLGHSEVGAQSAPAPAPYSLPWLLRPTAAANVVRLDETIASFKDPASHESGTTAVTSFLASRRVTKSVAPLFRLSWVTNSPPKGTESGSGFSNPLLGAAWAKSHGPWRGALLGAFALPLGQGGGKKPDVGAAAAMARAVPARSAMDNALFAVNYWTAIVGVGASWVDPRLTVQGELTALRLTRARGPEVNEKQRTNLTAGLHVGRFVSKRVSIGAELRMQRWLSDVKAVQRDPHARETVTASIGSRLHLPLAGGRWIRPGIAWTHALDRPLSPQSYDMVQIDVPLNFAAK